MVMISYWPPKDILYLLRDVRVLTPLGRHCHEHFDAEKNIGAAEPLQTWREETIFAVSGLEDTDMNVLTAGTKEVAQGERKGLILANQRSVLSEGSTCACAGGSLALPDLCALSCSHTALPVVNISHLR